MRLALEKITNGKPVEALHLTDVVLSGDPQNAAALKARIQALEVLQKDCENFVEDGWLTYGITKAKKELSPGNAK